MSIYTVSKDKVSSSGGPCGGRCTPKNADCGCNEGVLIQPRFFSGQLLTDDDLQALTNYVVTRQRLHNRFLVGSGVGCGLLVSCHPCGGGRVIVQPGYAVDCCGNEILVPCDVELDINAMVRDLRFSKHGYDCGDPCVDTHDPDPVSQPGQPLPGGTSFPATRRDPKKDAQQYCLYVNYCEQPSDLVAPYTQDDSCAVTCEPSRIREGFSFELRCPSEEPDPPSVVDRIRCCIADLDEADRNAADIERGQLQIRRNHLGVMAHQQQVAAQFTDADLQLIMSAAGPIADVTVSATAHSDKPVSGDEQKLRRRLDQVQALGVAIARFRLQDESTQAALLEQHAGLADKLDTNHSLLNELAPALAEQAKVVLSSPLERTVAKAVVDNTIKYIDPQLPVTERQSIEGSIFAYSGVSSAAATSRLNDILARFKTWLLRRMDQCPPTGQCCLIEEVQSIVIPTGDTSDETTIRAAERLSRALIRYLLDCICSALLPPCPDCDDPAVKLACLDVIDCKVDNICNLERTFLLTEHNLRYWIPLLHQIGEAFESACCDFARRFEIRYDPDRFSTSDDFLQAQQQLNGQPGFFASGTQVGDAVASDEVFPNLLRVAGLSARTVRPALNVGGNVLRLSGRDPVVSSVLARQEGIEAAGDLGAAALAGVLELPPAKVAIEAAAERGFATLEERMGALSARGMQLVEETRERIDSRLSEIETDVGKRVTSSGLAQTKVIRDLKAMLEAREAENKALAQRLTKLESEA
ncbi:MAG: hypothetical protein ACR2RB_10365 [Gammaproteobacteria bacterium]